MFNLRLQLSLLFPFPQLPNAELLLGCIAPLSYQKEQLYLELNMKNSMLQEQSNLSGQQPGRANIIASLKS
jgi:hypothetical protein